jgi:hypothetical protein
MKDIFHNSHLVKLGLSQYMTSSEKNLMFINYKRKYAQAIALERPSSIIDDLRICLIMLACSISPKLIKEIK